ncbi:MAG: glycosyltransferase [Planctomycetales bacterium]
MLYLGGGRSELRPGATPEGRTERPYIFYPANAYPHKNHPLLVRAFRQFKEQHPEQTAQLVMTGQRQPHLDEELARCRPEHGIFHLGFVSAEELDRLYRDCRAVFFPSLFEGFGIPIIEGMSYGKPIFCHRLPVFEELVGEKVRYFEATSEAPIITTLERIFDRDADLSVDLGAYEQVLRGLNWDNYGNTSSASSSELAAESTSEQSDSLQRAA